MGRGVTKGQVLECRKDDQMNLKWIGGIIILLGCGGFGFCLAAANRRQIRELRELSAILDFLSCELRYRLTPLPELCLMAARHGRGSVARVFRSLHAELERQISPDARCCMSAAVSDSCLSPPTKQFLRDLGNGLGRFDLDGQLQEIQATKEKVEQLLDKLTKDLDVRLRSYQTLGLCAGAALAILLL